jgi:hypothetical protein
MIAEYPDLPNNGENLDAFAGSVDSVLVAQRGPRNPEELFGGRVKYPGNLGYIQDAKTGFTIMVNEYISQLTRAAGVRLDWLQGFDPGNGNNGVRVRH